ncbi:hypothetical protein CLOLEP_00344 [[Clostridium] leptum DSM 753]|uniref:Uncharacterized protein n=1 Tax=[Clostridium] leptum DSM 753 TaxID=428125 RepID=A7VP68_9FIRM|nr:hypothetical protein CLOLEP_00344 [[Clostridium] leptum DSM 753]
MRNRFFVIASYLKLTKGGTSPWRNKIAADVLFVFSKNGERYARHEDGSQIKIE